jgi:hypothetical protein
MTTLARTHTRLVGRTIPREALAPTERRAMFDLLSTFFTGVTPDTFAADLSAKTHVILLEDDDGVLRGFSTLLVYRTAVTGVDATIVYSGDTIVHRASWGSAALPLSWLGAVRALTSDTNTRDVFWLLLTSGFRTYRFLPVFWREFYPRVDSESVSKVLVDAIARERFGALYHEADGVVRFTRPQILVPELLDVAAGRTHDEHIAFFLKRNPGFTNGDELVCLTNIGEANLTSAGQRIARGLSMHQTRATG